MTISLLPPYQKKWRLAPCSFFLTGTFLLFAYVPSGYAQAIKGISRELAGQEISLRVFDRFRDTLLIKTKADSTGAYSLPIPGLKEQMGILQQPGKDMLLVLSPAGDSICYDNTGAQPAFSFKKGGVNEKIDLFFRKRAEQKIKLSAIDFLLNKYDADKTAFQQALVAEKALVENDLSTADQQLDHRSGDFDAYFSRLQSWVSDAQTAIMSGKQVTECIRYFEQHIDLQDERLFQTGLIKRMLEVYYKLQEARSGGDFEEIKKMFNVGTDTIIRKLGNQQQLQAEYANHLFHWFESISMPYASEYLSLKMLNDNSCSLPDALTQRMEQYRTLGIGKTAPDIVYEKDGQKQALSKISSRYKLVVFWASWCGHCEKDIPVLHEELQHMKEKGIEVVAISLDQDPASYQQAAAGYRWGAYCDFKGFESPVSKDYHIFATPTFFMLDQDMKIVYKPVSVDALKAWLALI